MSQTGDIPHIKQDTDCEAECDNNCTKAPNADYLQALAGEKQEKLDSYANVADKDHCPAFSMSPSSKNIFDEQMKLVHKVKPRTLLTFGRPQDLLPQKKNRKTKKTIQKKRFVNFRKRTREINHPKSGRITKDLSSNLIDNLTMPSNPCPTLSDGDAVSLQNTDSGIKSTQFNGKHALIGRKREKHYKCDYCGVGFFHNSTLLEHRRIHTGEKPFKCDICGVGFGRKTRLQEHKTVHTGEKPFKCDVCGVGFTRKYHLQEHKRVHTGERPFKCDICGAGFTHKGHIRGHKRVHTGERPFKCHICGIGFTQKGNLYEHNKIHTGEKPYQCDVCGVRFTQKGNLHEHTKLHTGEKPYRCDHCGLKFSRKDRLHQHNKTVHT